MNSSLLALLLLLLALASNTPATPPPVSPPVPSDHRYDNRVLEERSFFFDTLAERSDVRESHRYFDYRDRFYDLLESRLKNLLVAYPGVISEQLLEFAQEHKRKEGEFEVDDEVEKLQALLKDRTLSRPDVVKDAVKDLMTQAATEFSKLQLEDVLHHYIDEDHMDELLRKLLPGKQELIRCAREFVNGQKRRLRINLASGRDQREIETVLNAITEIEPADTSSKSTRRPTPRYLDEMDDTENAGPSSMSNEDKSEKIFFIEESKTGIISLVKEAKRQIDTEKAALDYAKLKSYDKDGQMAKVLNSLLKKDGQKSKMDLNLLKAAKKTQDEVERLQKQTSFQKFNDDRRMIYWLELKGAGELNDIEKAFDFARKTLSLKYAVEKGKAPYAVVHFSRTLDNYCKSIPQDSNNGHDIEAMKICKDEIPRLNFRALDVMISMCDVRSMKVLVKHFGEQGYLYAMEATDTRMKTTSNDLNFIWFVYQLDLLKEVEPPFVTNAEELAISELQSHVLETLVEKSGENKKVLQYAVERTSSVATPAVSRTTYLTMVTLLLRSERINHQIIRDAFGKRALGKYLSSEVIPWFEQFEEGEITDQVYLQNVYELLAAKL